MDPDIETMQLMAELAIGDLKNISDSRKGKGRWDAPLSDEDLAFQLQNIEIEDLLGLLRDSRVAKSINQAIQVDQSFLTALSIMEEAAVDDHHAALALSRGQALPGPSASQMLLEDTAFCFPNDIKMAVDSAPPAEVATELIVPVEVQPDQSLNLPPEPGASKTSKRLNCIVCGDQTQRRTALQAPCQHVYCPPCVISLITTLTHDESLYPPRCCKQPITLEDIFPLLQPSLLKLFREKIHEFSTPGLNRLYCPSPACSVFIGSSADVSEGMACPTCGTLACPNCKQAAHPQDNCQENTAILEVRALARSEQWQTCPGCMAIVELHQGCYHMTCRCRTQFCYLCAELWKNCTCAHWDEGRLINAAAERVQNEVGVAARLAQPDLFQARVRERAQRLRFDHDCEQHKWRKRDGGGLCGVCSNYLRDYLLICRNCSIAACVRCARNRF